MPHFTYQALDANREIVIGQIDADSVAQAIEQIEAKGLSVQSIGPAAARDALARSHTATSSEEAARRALHTHLTDFLARAKAFTPALRAYAEELPPRRRRELGRLTQLIESGDVAGAARAVGANPKLWIPLLSTAASSHDPAKMLREFVDESRRNDDLRRQRQVTLAYPLFLGSVTLAVFVLLSFLVIPTFRAIFADFGLRLPALTLLILNAAEFIASRQFVITVAIVGVVAVVVSFSQRSLPAFRDWLMGSFDAPFGRTTAIARLARYTSDLLAAGLDAPAALRIAGQATHRMRLRTTAWRMADDIESGRPCDDSDDYPRLTTMRHALQSDMPAASRIRLLSEIGACFAERARSRLAWTRGGLEPIAIAFVGGLILLLVIGLFQPLLSLIGGLS